MLLNVRSRNYSSKGCAANVITERCNLHSFHHALEVKRLSVSIRVDRRHLMLIFRGLQKSFSWRPGYAPNSLCC